MDKHWGWWLVLSGSNINYQGDAKPFGSGIRRIRSKWNNEIKKFIRVNFSFSIIYVQNPLNYYYQQSIINVFYGFDMQLFQDIFPEFFQWVLLAFKSSYTF